MILPVHGAVRLGAYGPALRRLITGAKYEGRSEVLALLGEELARSVLREPWGTTVDAVIPVPSSWSRRVSRPLHLPSELAHVLSRRLHRPVMRLLERVGHPRPQTGLTITARRNNVRGTFRLARGVTIEGSSLLVVDDVMTSRATVFECARVLRRAGAESVYAATVAKTEPPRALPFIGMPS